MCDPNAIEIILTFAVGGITLRAFIAWLKKKLKAKDLGAFFLSLLCCVVAAALYILVKTIIISGGHWPWICFLWYSFEVFAACQLGYRIPKHLIYTLSKQNL